MVETLNCLQFTREKGAFLHMRNPAATRFNSLQLATTLPQLDQLRSKLCFNQKQGAG
jgi:hypothetical protein